MFLYHIVIPLIPLILNGVVMTLLILAQCT